MNLNTLTEKLFDGMNAPSILDEDHFARLPRVYYVDGYGIVVELSEDHVVLKNREGNRITYNPMDHPGVYETDILTV